LVPSKEREPAAQYLPNTEVERLALHAVRMFEKRRLKLRSIRGIRRARKRSGYDIISANRRIEVKGTQGQQHFQKLVVSSLAEVRNLRRGGWLYRVTGIGSGHVRVHPYRGNQLAFREEKRWRVGQKQ
jgi:hypothetical protein